MIRKTFASAFSLAAIMTIGSLMPSDVYSQNVASQKAIYKSHSEELLNPKGAMILEGDIKTSGVGDLLIGVSMECALWTGTSNTATKGGSKTTSESRAAVNVRVYVDGALAEPGQVVYCDRQQTVSLQFLSDDTINITNDAILLEMFLKTKNANHFNFYANNPGSGVHHVEVYVDSFVEYTAGSPEVVVSNTRAAVGKRSLAIEESNNP